MAAKTAKRKEFPKSRLLPRTVLYNELSQQTSTAATETTMSELNSLTSAQLAETHNSILADLQALDLMTDRKPAGPKTFSTKKKAIARITKLNTLLAKAKKPTKTKKPARGVIKQFCEKLLLVEDEDGIGMTYESIMESLHNTHPTAKTTVGCLRWYATKLREAGQIVPDRPRKKVSK